MISPVVSLGFGLTVGLILVAFASGVGITAIGPGGIFLTIALYTLTDIGSDVIAGTVQVAFIATGLVGTAAYVRSGELARGNLSLAGLLCAGSVGGAVAGAWLNGLVSRDLFGVLLGLLTGVAGVVIVYREYRGLSAVHSFDLDSTAGRAGYFVVGVVLGVLSGLLGVGGPVIAVPTLVLLGVPMLSAVAVAQAQGVFIATFAALGFLTQGVVSVPLATLVGVPLLAGVLVGWKVAHYVDPGRLKVVLGAILILVAPTLVV